MGNHRGARKKIEPTAWALLGTKGENPFVRHTAQAFFYSIERSSHGITKPSGQDKDRTAVVWLHKKLGGISG